MATATKLTPLHDRIVVKRDPEQDKTAGGIYIPETAREKSQFGEVVAVGLGRRNDAGQRIPLDIKVGDRVMFGKYAGTEAKRYYYESGGEELVVMREEEVLGIIG